MKTLAQYMAEYLNQEIDKFEISEYENQKGEAFGEGHLHKWIEEGLDAYQSTENCTVSVMANLEEKPLSELADEKLIRKITGTALSRMTDVVYDKLMENKGPPYEALDLSKVEDQQVDAVGGLITFDYGDVAVKVKVNVGIKTKSIKYYECGCCGHFHREDYAGDCRNDAERFTLDDLLQRGIEDTNIIDLEEQLPFEGLEDNR